MKSVAALLVAVVVLSSSSACCRLSFLGLELEIPGDLVGEMQEDHETVPLGDAESATVEIGFGAGEITIGAGTTEDLLSGRFLYNVAGWAPEISYEDDVLVVEQGKTVAGWSTLTGATKNEWELELSPDVSLDLIVAIGAGAASLDLAGLQLESLDLDLGAGDFDVRFDEPNEAVLRTFTLDAGAADVDVTGIGNAGPRAMTVQGGVGSMDLDFRGEWSASADVTISAGVGAITIFLPNDVGVRVEAQGGLTNVTASGLEKTGSAYVNEAYGEADTELRIQVTTGLGSIRLVVLGDGE